MARLTLDEFRGRFAGILAPADSIVVVYSGIWTFGHLFGLPLRDLPLQILQAMIDAVGPQRTLLLPAYTYAYTRTRLYSPTGSKPETGVLPATMLDRVPAVRTRSALNSFLAHGPRASELAAIRGETLWGEGSLKWYFQRQRARIVVLGLPWETACGFLHRIEEEAEAPYRYYKTFKGQWEERAAREPWSETMFVRSLTCRPVFRWSLVADALRSRGLVRTAPGEIELESADAADIVSTGVELVTGDPYALLANAADVRDWVLHRKEREIEELRAAEPAALEYHDRRMRIHTG